MATIDIKSVGDLLILSVSGELSAEEVIAVVNEYYPNGIVKDVIWDLTNGSLQKMSQEDFKAIARAAKESVAQGFRQGGNTVYVGNSAVEYSLLSMYTAIAELTGVPITYHVFKTIEEVRTWLGQD
ncbi:MAG: hypothetical protein WCP20_19575 [Desulfuromonadales bacterium]